MVNLAKYTVPMDPMGLTSVKKTRENPDSGNLLANHAAKNPLERCPNHESNVQKNNIRKDDNAGRPNGRQ